MRDTVFFMNDGHFDVRAMLTFGVSAKESDDAIGYFGTGFKYAVAIILRLGGSVTIETAGESYRFEARKESIRGQEFELVYVNGQEAGFTTRLGINWQPWMAFRELYCNCKDEGGEISQERGDFDTVIAVTCPEIANAYRSRSDYFISGTPVHVSAECEMYEGSRPYLYYKGVAVMRASEESCYSYNITSHVDLTEDRTVRHSYQIQWPIQRTIQALDSAPMLRTILSRKDCLESKSIGFDPDWPVSDAFVDVCRQLMKTDVGLPESARLLMSKVAERMGDWPEFEPTKTELKALDKAKAFLRGINIPVDDYPIKTVTGLGEGVMGRALNGIIYISDIPFQMGTKQLASTLLEEWMHIKTGAKDFDRTMQSWLFDKVLSIGEELIGEPL